MMPSVLRRTGPDIERNGVMVTPRGIVSTCEVQPCELPAPFGMQTKAGYLTWCAVHLPAGFLPAEHYPRSEA